MQLTILCFDGLDPRLVETFRLRGLIQEYMGIHRVDTRYNSVQLWRAFLTGKSPGEFGSGFVETRGPGIPGLLKRVVPPRVRRLLYMARAKPPTTPVEETFIVSARRPVVYNMFAFNEEPRQFRMRLRYSLPRIVGDAEASRKAYREWERWTSTQFDRLVTLVEQDDWDLLLTHFYITDIAGHLAVKPNLAWMVAKAYRLAETIASTVRHRLRGRAAVLIVSDHGMRRGMHTPTGFWSLSVEPPFSPGTITDFRRLVEVVLHEY